MSIWLTQLEPKDFRRISESDYIIHRRVLAKVKDAMAVRDFWFNFLVEHYDLQPTEAVTENGDIIQQPGQQMPLQFQEPGLDRPQM